MEILGLGAFNIFRVTQIELEKASKNCGWVWIGGPASSLENEIRIRNELDKLMKQPYINNTKLRQVKAVHCRRRKPKAEHEHWSNWIVKHQYLIDF